MLQKLFEKFDKESTDCKLYKLCTIGDAYVAVIDEITSPTPDYNERDAIDNVLKMGNLMIAHIETVRESLNVSVCVCVLRIYGTNRENMEIISENVRAGLREKVAGFRFLVGRVLGVARFFSLKWETAF